MHLEYKDHFDFCKCLPNVYSPKWSGSNMSNFISARNANWFRLEIVRTIIHLVLHGSIRLFQIFYRPTGDEDTRDEKGTHGGGPPEWRHNSFSSIYKRENYFFVSNYTNYVERKTICSHVLNIYSAFHFCQQVIQLYDDAQFEMLLWSNLYNMLLICQQKYPFFFLPFSKMFSKYFKDYQKRSYSPFDFYFLLYGVSDVNAFEKENYNVGTNYQGDSTDYHGGVAKGEPFNLHPHEYYATNGQIGETLKQKYCSHLTMSKEIKGVRIYKYNIVGYIKLITILKNVKHTNKLKKNFIQMSFIKYIIRYIHSFLKSLIVSISSANLNYFNNAILFQLKNIMAFFFGYGIPPCCSGECPRIYRPHYDQLRSIASKGVQINDLIKFLRTYYDNDKLLEWKIVASEFINVLKNMKELQLFVDSPTVSLQNFNFAKENIWLTLIDAKLRNDIYKLPMDLKRDIMLLLKNIRMVDMCLGTNHYEHINNIFTVCWFIIVKIFQNYEKRRS